MLPEGFDREAPREAQVEQLVASGFYDRQAAEDMVELLNDPQPGEILL